MDNISFFLDDELRAGLDLYFQTGAQARANPNPDAFEIVRAGDSISIKKLIDDDWRLWIMIEVRL